MKPTVIYHSADADGWLCREIARKFLPDAELIGWNYGDPHLEFPREGTVYVLDLSPDCFWESPLRTEFVNRLIWIDHHKSSIEKYDPTGWVHEPAGLDSFKVPYNEFWRKGHETRTTAPISAIAGYRIDGVAACRLAWQWFAEGYSDKPFEVIGEKVVQRFPPKEMFFARAVAEPLAVRLAGEYDVHDEKQMAEDPRIELFQHGLRSMPLSENVWDCLLVPFQPEREDGKKDLGTIMVEAMLDQGKCLKFARDEEYRDVITQQGFDVEFEGLKFLACNSHGLDIRSQLFEAGIKPHHDGLLGFTWNGKSWRVSMYGVPGKPEIDFSVIAKKHGGGGHRQACGFIAKTLPFEL